MSERPDRPEDLPSTAGDFAEQYTDVWKAYTELGKSSSEAGPLNDRSRRLVKLALAVASESEGAVHSHVRRALDEGIDPEELRHVAVLSIPTIGFPKAMAAMTWIDDLLEES